MPRDLHGLPDLIPPPRRHWAVAPLFLLTTASLIGCFAVIVYAMVVS